MWASDRARNAAIRKMLGPVRAARWWTEDGPTRTAEAELEEVLRARGPLSSGERVLLRAAFDLWNGEGQCTIDSLLCTLDADNLALVAEAILARDLP